MNAFWLEFWRYFSSFACQSMMFYIMTDCRFSRGASRWAWTLLCVFSTFLSIGVTFLWLVHEAVLYFAVSAAVMALYVACYVYLSYGERWKKLFVVSVYLTLHYWALQAGYTAMRVWFPDSPWVSFLIRTVFFCLLILLMARWWRPVMDALEANIGGNWGILAAYGTVTSAAVYAAAIIWVVFLGSDPKGWLAALLTELTLVTVEYASLVQIVVLLGQRQTARAEEAQRKLLESQLADEKAYVEQAQAHRHDMRHYTAVIGGYLEQGDLAGAKACLAEHQALLDNALLVNYCENTVANALLRLAQKRCRADGAACEIRASIPEQMALNGLELATVLGNVLENAWESNRRALVPKLAVRAHAHNGLLRIEVENGVLGEVLFREGLPQTTKPGGGLGLKNAVQTLDRHGGMLQCAQRGDIFFTQIIVPL